MSIQAVIDEHLNNEWDAGDAFACLHRAVTTNDPEQARFAALRCYDVARRLEAKQRKDPAHPPAPETVVAARKPVNLIDQPGWQERLDRAVDGDEQTYLWGCQRWTIRNGLVYCWNVRNGTWDESTMTPDQLKADATLEP